MKKILAILLTLAAIVCAFPISMAAEEAAPVNSVEIVLLLDVSASMNMADPQRTVGDTVMRVSTEAALNFVYNYPTETAMYMKVIPYNAAVYTGFDSVNVSTEKGLEKYEKNMQMILDDLSENSTIDAISCYRFATDIGAALEAATETVSASTAEKKAVILFTDGKIELAYRPDEELSHQKAADSKTALEKLGVPIYCIGLNQNNSVDAEFLKGLSDSEYTPGETVVVTKASELGDVFRRIYTYLFADSRVDPDPIEVTVQPTVPTEQAIRMYGDAVKEANVAISSDAQLYSVKVTTPSGVVVADIDYATGRENVNTDYCVVNASPSRCTASIKLTKPMDGDWLISFTGDESTVVMSRLYLFELKLHHDLNAAEVYVDDTLSFSATIYNKETDKHVASAGLYEGETGAMAMVDVINTEGGRGDLYSGTLNAAKNGYDFDVKFDAPGVYDLKMTIEHSQFCIEGTARVTVLGPTLALTADGDVLNVQLTHPITGGELTDAPAFVSGMAGSLRVLSGETVVLEEAFTASDMENGTYTAAFEAPMAGVYTAEATLTGYDTSITSGAVSLTVAASEITLKDKLDSTIKVSGMSADFEKEFDLDDYFEDSDGDELTYTVDVEDADLIKASVKNGELTISTKDFGKSTVRITATDGKGTEFTHEITVIAKSMLGTVIALAIVAVVLIAAVVIFLIVVNKRKVIRFGFKVKLERNEDDNYTSAVFNVGRLASNKRAKPTMALDTLLSSHNTFSQLLRSDFADGELEALTAQCAPVTVTGQPFKRAFDVALKGKKKSTFMRSQVRVAVPGTNLTVIFGSVNDFNDTDNLYGY